MNTMQRLPLRKLAARTALVLGMAVLATSPQTAHAQSAEAASQTTIATRSDGATVTMGYSGLCTALNCPITGLPNVISDPSDDFASLTIVGLLGAAAYIEVTFPADQPAGTSAGFLIETAANSATLFSSITLSTYSAAGAMLESTDSDATLAINVLSGDMKSVEFETSQSFRKIRLTNSGLASISLSQRVYYAYSSLSTLPVELAAFESLADGDAVLLRWQTASELNNAGFAVQHKSEGDFQEMGFVAGAGTTVEARRYSYRAGGLAPGRHVFRLKQVDYDGAFAYSPELEVAVVVPGRYELSPAYPNPFNPRTSFSLSVAERQQVTVVLYNTLGQRVRTLFEGVLEAGQARLVTLEAGDLPSGTYFYRATGKAFSASKRVLLLK